MRKRRLETALALLAATLTFACAAKQPVLYPNAHLKQVGREAGQVDIEECIELAESGVGDRNRAAGTAGRSAAGAAGGAAIGAVGGAITGNAGIGAAVGAATGATGGLLSGLWSFRDRDPTFMNFVDTCLRERGYQPIGWR